MADPADFANKPPMQANAYGPARPLAPQVPLEPTGSSYSGRGVGRSKMPVKDPSGRGGAARIIRQKGR